MNKKLALVVLFAVSIVGCKTNSPTFEPLPPEKLNNLLYEEDLRNIAYKSVTKDDYIIKEDC